jgi:hypothetical protein
MLSFACLICFFLQVCRPYPRQEGCAAAAAGGCARFHDFVAFDRDCDEDHYADADAVFNAGACVGADFCSRDDGGNAGNRSKYACSMHWKKSKMMTPMSRFFPRWFSQSFSRAICLSFIAAFHHHFDHHPRYFYHHHREQFYKDTLDKAETLLAEGCHPCSLLESLGSTGFSV